MGLPYLLLQTEKNSHDSNLLMPFHHKQNLLPVVKEKKYKLKNNQAIYYYFIL